LDEGEETYREKKKKKQKKTKGENVKIEKYKNKQQNFFESPHSFHFFACIKRPESFLNIINIYNKYINYIRNILL